MNENFTTVEQLLSQPTTMEIVLLVRDSKRKVQALHAIAKPGEESILLSSLYESIKQTIRQEE